MDPFVAEIRIFPFNFAPRGWAMCNGQILPISQNTALFSLLGTNYGGNGQTTFALPNLQGRVPLCPGQGQGLSLYDLGQTGGAETVTLDIAKIPTHNHPFNASQSTGTAKLVTNNRPGQISTSGTKLNKTSATLYSDVVNPLIDVSPFALSAAGGSLPHNNMMPFVTLNFCIAMQGVFPPRG